MKGVKVGRFFSVVGGVLLWAVAIFAMVSFGRIVRTNEAEVVVSSICVEVVDSAKRDNLLTSQMVLNMLSGEKIKGQRLQELNLTQLEQKIKKSGYVKSAEVYCVHGGELRIDVTQQRAAARLLIDGYNCYISEDGYIFPATYTTSLYTPVVTGNYSLALPRGFVGNIDDYALERIWAIDEQIAQIESERYPILQRERENNADRKELRRQYISPKLFEDRADYVKRFTDLRISNQKKRELYAYRQRMIDKDMAKIDSRIAAKRNEQLKILQRCDEIHNLLTFIAMLESDRFWRSEVVQLIATSGSRGEMRLSMSVRSGTFDVTLGELFEMHGEVARRELSTIKSLREQKQRVIEGDVYSERSLRRVIASYRSTEHKLVRKGMSAKLDRVRYFYKEALDRVGWDLYRDINVEFENQIVCRK